MVAVSSVVLRSDWLIIVGGMRIVVNNFTNLRMPVLVHTALTPVLSVEHHLHCSH